MTLKRLYRLPCRKIDTHLPELRNAKRLGPRRSVSGPLSTPPVSATPATFLPTLWEEHHEKVIHRLYRRRP
ncbi:MAG: hypothetical protein LBS70_05145, partial [Candidatus Accumulibacter sp.]|nr:hypothetical protein [Accumulibacter sp.]